MKFKDRLDTLAGHVACLRTDTSHFANYVPIK